MQNLLTDIIKTQIGKSFSEKAGKSFGASSAQSQSAMEAAMPFLLGALAKNSSSSDGASQLSKALEKDHDGSIFNHMDGLFSDSKKQEEGSGILKHILGNKQSEVEKYMAKESGMKSEDSGKMLKLLAPLLMGALGKAQKTQGLGVGQLSNLLQLSAKSVSGGNQGMIASFLDKDGDGKISDDLLSMGTRFIKKRFFG